MIDSVDWDANLGSIRCRRDRRDDTLRASTAHVAIGNICAGAHKGAGGRWATNSTLMESRLLGTMPSVRAAPSDRTWKLKVLLTLRGAMDHVIILAVD